MQKISRGKLWRRAPFRNYIPRLALAPLQRREMTLPQLALFDRAEGPEGLSYKSEFVTPAEELELIGHIRRLPLRPFQFGQYEGKRRIASFGWHYNFSSQRLEAADPIPQWALTAIRAVEQAEGLPEDAIGHVLLTEYEAGSGIGWHRDKKQFDEVFGLSLGSSCHFRFRRKTGAKWERYTLQAEARSLYAITGEARSIWEHSIPPVDALRYSITFRTMAATYAPR